MVGHPTQDIESIEIMKYMGWSRHDLCETPIDVVNAVKERMTLENKANKNGKK